MQVLCILIDHFVSGAISYLTFGALLALALGVATFDWKRWWDRCPWSH